MLAYQVWEWTMSQPAALLAIERSADERAQRGVGAGQQRVVLGCAVAPGRGAPMQCTSTSASLTSSRTRKSTWTPAPP